MSRHERPRVQGSARPQFPRRRSHVPSREGRPDEIHLDDLRLDPFERLTLALLRWHFQNLAQPDSHGWLMAMRVAAAHVGSRQAGVLCYDIVGALQSLRMARKTPVSFNPEGCGCCRVWVTPDERRLVELLKALRKGQQGQAQIIAQVLCDGVPDTPLLASMQVLLTHHAPSDPLFH